MAEVTINHKRPSFLKKPFSLASDGVCICPDQDCKTEVPHKTGVPCFQMKCPKCGTALIRK